MSNPFSDLDGTNDGDDFPDWLDMDADEPGPEPQPEPTRPAAHTQHREPPTQQTPRIFSDTIDTDDQETAEWEDTDNPEDFGDYTPRKTRFSPPSEELIFGATTPAKTSRRTDREDSDDARQEKREERERKKEEKRREREQHREERQQRREEKRREREQHRKEKATASANGADRETTPVKRGAATIIGVAAVIFLVTGCSLYLFNKADNNPTVTAASTTPPASSQPTTSAAPDPATVLAETANKACAEHGGRNGEGDRSTPEGTIEGLNHAYYVTKDAKQAAYFLDKEMYASVEGLQEGIDTPTNGDAFCVVINPVEGKPDTFTVELTQFFTPAEGETTAESDTQQQEITVANSPDGWYITNQVLL